MKPLIKHNIENYKTDKNANNKKISISYQVFGKKINTAPIVIVNHALTGNSDVISHEKGWWKEIVGDNKLIDTQKYTVIAFNIPGNGYGGNLIDNYKDYTTKDIARIFHTVLKELNIEKVFAIIGGSLGGGIAWEMACLFPKFSSYIIPIASDWKSSDWIIGHNAIQESILLNSKKPLEDARKMAMLFYRTPESFTHKFNRTKTKEKTLYTVESWLNHHAEKLKNRFEIKAYLMMNQLLTSINVVPEGKTLQEVLSKIESTIIQISVSSDLFFIPGENLKTKKILDDLQITNQYHEIKSIDGHDAFLIEHKQITDFLSPIF
jgi:homoserine O-acetyltransferase